jgi:integrase
MARIEFIQLPPHGGADSALIGEHPNPNRRRRLPQIFWENHVPWEEANLWAYTRTNYDDVDPQTVESNMRGLTHYASFLEATRLDWRSFPIVKAERSIVRYRGFLKNEIKNGHLASSTASFRMRYVISFYRWLQSQGILKNGGSLWKDTPIHIKFVDAVGFERTMTRITTDLSLPNRSRPGARLEHGLLPVSMKDRDAILSFVKSHASDEYFLILAIGFFTGMRLGTICDLKIDTLSNAIPDPIIPKMFHLAVGPGASPPVQTKLGVTGHVWIPDHLLELLKQYAFCPRRLQREAKAMNQNRELLFLTRFGNPFSRGESEKSSAINVEISRLRRLGREQGLLALEHFRFHQTRATFGTELARIALREGDNISAIAFVRDALLHKDEATSLKYIRFVESSPIKEAAANAFTAVFFNIENTTQNVAKN